MRVLRHRQDVNGASRKGFLKINYTTSSMSLSVIYMEFDVWDIANGLCGCVSNVNPGVICLKTQD